MKFLTPEEVGLILEKLVIEDEKLVQALYISAKNQKDKLESNDIEAFTDWLTFLTIYSRYLNNN